MNGNSINRVELQGRVGTVRIQSAGGCMVASFSMMTDEVYKANDGTAICETTWHHVTAWEGKEVCLDGLGRGSLVHVEGRIRNSMYTASDGTERGYMEVMASSLKVLE